ncbi:MAG: hypothetical protein E7626_08170 [Ruminococcaceae bacterium]|nr:hypothetical protein [Oscillospiraceae bacterium]
MGLTMQKDEKFERETNKKEDSFFKRRREEMRERLTGKDEIEVRRRLHTLVSFFLTAATTYLIGGSKLFFGTYPLAIAFACSSKKHLPAVAVGLLAAVIGGMPAVYGYICVAVLLIRMLSMLLPLVFSETIGSRGDHNKQIIKYGAKGDEQDRSEEEKGFGSLFSEDLHVKALCSALGGAIGGVFLVLRDDFSFYSLCGMLTLIFLPPVATLLFGGVLGEERYKKEWYSCVSMGAIVFLAVLTSAEKTVLGMPMTPFLAILLTLCISSQRGIFFGLGAALLCGLAFDPLYMILLVLSAALFCIVSAVKRNAGIAAVCGLIVVWCYYIGGEQGLVKVLPPMLLAIPIYMLVDKYREMMNAPYARAEVAGGLYFAEAVTEKTKNAAVKDRLSTLEATFSSLSETFYKLSDRFRRPDVLGIRQITDTAFERVCEGCRNRERCWGADYSNTLESVRRVTSALHTKGTVEASDLTEKFVSECIGHKRLLDEVNSEVSEATQRIINGGKASFFADNYDDITAILKDALGSDSEEYECDLDAGKKVFEYIYSEGLRVGGVVVYGKRCKHVVAKGISNSDKLSAEKAAELCQKISAIVGADLSDPVIEVGRDGAVMLLHSRPTVKAICAHGRLSRSGRKWTSNDPDEPLIDPLEESEDETCGDMTDAFVTDNSYFYSLISDGMGSGPEAAFTSGVCSMFMQKMLSAGNRADITLRMLNNVIRSENMGCGRECSATVDLLELDLMSGTAAFVKSGAAPTYIAREGTVYKISSRTMPMGIIKNADARITKFDTKAGDIIIMMSDGCCPDSEDCTWLVEYLCSYMSKGKRTVSVGEELSERLRDEILNEAVKNLAPDRERDDISVSVVVVG